jgi:hypothetical protein
MQSVSAVQGTPSPSRGAIWSMQGGGWVQRQTHPPPNLPLEGGGAEFTRLDLFNEQS